MVDAALLLLRGVAGGLLAGHGAQKVFGAFDGPGPEGTRGMAERLRMRPAAIWGHAAGLSELAGGALTALGALSPIGPLTGIAPMAIATTTVHRGKPVWAAKGGAELPLVNMACFGALALAGPGRLSVDAALGIRLPRWLVGLAAAGIIGGTAAALVLREEEAEPERSQAEAEREEAAAAAAEYRERELELHAERAQPSRRGAPQPQPS